MEGEPKLKKKNQQRLQCREMERVEESQAAHQPRPVLKHERAGLNVNQFGNARY